MYDTKKTCYYAIVNKKSKLLLVGCLLPFYWNKKIANKVAESFKDAKVIKIDAKKLNELLDKTN